MERLSQSGSFIPSRYSCKRIFTVVGWSFSCRMNTLVTQRLLQLFVIFLIMSASSVMWVSSHQMTYLSHVVLESCGFPLIRWRISVVWLSLSHMGLPSPDDLPQSYGSPLMLWVFSHQMTYFIHVALLKSFGFPFIRWLTSVSHIASPSSPESADPVSRPEDITQYLMNV